MRSAVLAAIASIVNDGLTASDVVKTRTSRSTGDPNEHIDRDQADRAHDLVPRGTNISVCDLWRQQVLSHRRISRVGVRCQGGD